MGSKVQLCDQLHRVPYGDTDEEILENASKLFFKPTLGLLTAYEYPGKAGIGTPKPVTATTTLDSI